MEAWRTSCPRQSVWEDAQATELVEMNGLVVILTEWGKAALKK
jgi:hypothetical protein